MLKKKKDEKIKSAKDGKKRLIELSATHKRASFVLNDQLEKVHAKSANLEKKVEDICSKGYSSN